MQIIIEQMSATGVTYRNSTNPARYPASNAVRLPYDTVNFLLSYICMYMSLRLAQ